ncbi:MAG: DUF2384 domain-containing protein [Melioribacteraceae bacterium]|nr:DUF2384 domain-containing protein [Melioribacteraceae bacterium]
METFIEKTKVKKAKRITIKAKDVINKKKSENKLNSMIEELFNECDFLKISNSVIRGFPVEYLINLKDLLGLTNDKLADLLGVSTRTITRSISLPKEERLTITLSDRVYRVFKIISIAIEVFNDKYEALIWLKTEQYGLYNETPISLLKTEAGTREVENLLGRIEYGVY